MTGHLWPSLGSSWLNPPANTPGPCSVGAAEEPASPSQPIRRVPGSPPSEDEIAEATEKLAATSLARVLRPRLGPDAIDRPWEGATTPRSARRRCRLSPCPLPCRITSRRLRVRAARRSAPADAVWHVHAVAVGRSRCAAATRRSRWPMGTLADGEWLVVRAVLGEGDERAAPVGAHGLGPSVAGHRGPERRVTPALDGESVSA
jgi:hypothetical protein